MVLSPSTHLRGSCVAPAGLRLATGKQPGLQSRITGDQEQAFPRLTTSDEAAELLTPSRGAGMQLDVSDRIGNTEPYLQHVPSGNSSDVQPEARSPRAAHGCCS